jgi:RNA-directed DNA polymerase
MSLQTPVSIRSLQRKLYGKAKTEPTYRFYLLYDKVWRADILAHAYDLARANGGAPGVDQVTFARIEAQGREDWLSRLGEELRAKHAHGLAKPDPRGVSVPAGAAGDDPQARRRRAAARHPDHSGPGGADRGEAGA